MIPPRRFVIGVPANVVSELTDDEIAWKIEPTAVYQALARRSLISMLLKITRRRYSNQASSAKSSKTQSQQSSSPPHTGHSSTLQLGT